MDYQTCTSAIPDRGEIPPYCDKNDPFYDEILCELKVYPVHFTGCQLFIDYPVVNMAKRYWSEAKLKDIFGNDVLDVDGAPITLISIPFTYCETDPNYGYIGD